MGRDEQRCQEWARGLGKNPAIRRRKAAAAVLLLPCSGGGLSSAHGSSRASSLSGGSASGSVLSSSASANCACWEGKRARRTRQRRENAGGRGQCAAGCAFSRVPVGGAKGSNTVKCQRGWG